MNKQSAPNPAREAARKLARELSKLSDEDRKARCLSYDVRTIEGRTLSPINTLLAATQDARVTVIGGFKQWLAAGRCVRKGEKALLIWVPKTVKGPGVNIITGGTVEEMEETR